MKIKAGDKVKPKPETRQLWRQKAPKDSINDVTCDQVYVIDNINNVALEPVISNKSIGSDGLPFDKNVRGLWSGLLVNGDVDQSFDIVGGYIEVLITKKGGGEFCNCSSTNTVKNYADGKEFLYCRGCKKERR